MTRVIFSLLAFAAFTGQTAPDQYATGQVWEYRTRQGDEGSLLKIQRIDGDPVFQDIGPIYHISVVGFHLSNPQMTPMLPHAPVSRQTLDASVTKLSTKITQFPDVDAGMAEWKGAEGRVYTISIADIIDSLDQATASFHSH